MEVVSPSANSVEISNVHPFPNDAVDLLAIPVVESVVQESVFATQDFLDHNAMTLFPTPMTPTEWLIIAWYPFPPIMCWILRIFPVNWLEDNEPMSMLVEEFLSYCPFQVGSPSMFL